jgi:hypothetical protein
MKTRTLAATLLGGLLLAPVLAHAGSPQPPLTASEHYSDVLVYTIDWHDSTYTLGATGMPDDVTFTDNGDGTGRLRGPVLVPAGIYHLDMTATDSSSTTFHRTLDLTVEPERALDRLARSNPTTVSRTKSFVLKARVKDQDDGSFGDVTLAGPGTFVLERRGHVTTCDAKVVAGSLFSGAGPDHYDVRCKVPSGLHRGSYDVTHVVGTDYYAGMSKVGSLRVTR